MRPVTPRLRLILEVFAGLALIAGALLFFGATRTDAWWAWTIAPPLTAATLGAFYWAAFVLILTAARSETWAEARPAVVSGRRDRGASARRHPVSTSTASTSTASSASSGSCAYALVPPLLAWALADQLRTRGEDRTRRTQRLPEAASPHCSSSKGRRCWRPAPSS